MHSARRFGEATDAFHQFVVLEEVLGLEELPSILGLHVRQGVVVPEIAHIAKSGCENGYASLLQGEGHFLE